MSLVTSCDSLSVTQCVTCHVSVITCLLSCICHYVSPVMSHLPCSEWSECFTFHTGISVPGKPPPPIVTTTGVTYIGIQWEGTKPCDGHVISYKLEMEDRSSVRQCCLVHTCAML